MDLSRIDAGSKLVLIFSMLSGGCIGSTAGGIKILRLIILMRLLYLMILKAGLSPNATIDVKEARILSFIAGSEEAGPVSELDLPEDAKCIYYYRDDKFSLMDEQTKIRKGDEIVVVTHVDNLFELNERWNGMPATGGK